MKHFEHLDDLDARLVRFDFEKGDWGDLDRMLETRGQLIVAGLADSAAFERGQELERRLGDFREQVSRDLYRVNQFDALQQTPDGNANCLDTQG